MHNDFKFDNLVLDPADPTRVRAVLDWEMATIGDPRLDLATTLGYWLEAGDPPPLLQLGLGITSLPGNWTREQVVAAYEAESGRSVGDPVWLFAFGLFKVAVIAQQIFARYAAGHTRGSAVLRTPPRRRRARRSRHARHRHPAYFGARMIAALLGATVPRLADAPR